MKKTIMNAVIGLMPLVSGILLVAFPDRAVMLAFLVLSVFLIVSGVKNLYYSVSMIGLPQSLRTVGIVKNIISVTVGAIMLWKSIARPEGLLSFVVYILASYLLLTAVIDALDTRWMRKLGLSDGIGGDVLVNLVFAVIMFCFPRMIGSTFLSIIGILLILIGALILAGTFFVRKSRYAGMHPGKDEAIDVEWEERK